jgi:hypothetical protein
MKKNVKNHVKFMMATVQNINGKAGLFKRNKARISLSPQVLWFFQVLIDMH